MTKDLILGFLAGGFTMTGGVFFAAFAQYRAKKRDGRE